MFEHANSKNRKQENKEEQLLIWKWRGSALPLLAKAIRMDANDHWPNTHVCTKLSGDADFQDVNDVVICHLL